MNTLQHKKLIFPEHGGVLVDADTKVVKTFKHREGKRTYTVKIVRYEPKTHAMYINGGRAYGYHILGLDGNSPAQLRQQRDRLRVHGKSRQHHQGRSGPSAPRSC